MLNRNFVLAWKFLILKHLLTIVSCRRNYNSRRENFKGKKDRVYKIKVTTAPPHPGYLDNEIPCAMTQQYATPEYRAALTRSGA